MNNDEKLIEAKRLINDTIEKIRNLELLDVESSMDLSFIIHDWLDNHEFTEDFEIQIYSESDDGEFDEEQGGNYGYL